MLGALDTARRYELFRELTSPAWQHNVSELLQRLANSVEQSDGDHTCDNELPYFGAAQPCAAAIRDAARFLQFAYDFSVTPITEPLSLDKLLRAGIVSDCRKISDNRYGVVGECVVDLARYRQQLSDAAVAIASRFGHHNVEMERRIRSAGASLSSDRIIRVTSLGNPITGSLLESFGAFLDLEFREYDYYAGVYDAIVSASDIRCNLQYAPDADSARFRLCREHVTENLYNRIVRGHARASYVFALQAKAEFAEQGALSYAYESMPAEDKDMRLIHEALLAALHAGRLDEQASQGAFFVEREFFDYLRDHGFEPTPTDDGATPLLQLIMDDSDRWSSELVRRLTDRQILLEQEAQRIIAERDPELDYGDQSSTALIGSVSYIVRKATFKHEEFEFSPSVAPADWAWRAITPYELGFDAVEGDLYATWQPTWAVTGNDLLSVRGDLGVRGRHFRELPGATGLRDIGIQLHAPDAAGVRLEFRRCPHLLPLSHRARRIRPTNLGRGSAHGPAGQSAAGRARCAQCRPRARHGHVHDRRNGHPGSDLLDDTLRISARAPSARPRGTCQPCSLPGTFPLPSRTSRTDSWYRTSARTDPWQ